MSDSPTAEAPSMESTNVTAGPAPVAPTPRVAARRTGNVRSGGRSARVVDAVLRTTLEVLGEVGYERLRIDEVARRSAVNKTTIYRRWPTRVELVREALMVLTRLPEPPLTGRIRDDLIAHLNASVAWLTSPVGRGIARVLMRGDPNNELHQISSALRSSWLVRRSAMLERAIAQGELPPTTDVHLVAATIHAGVYSRIVRWGEEPTAYLIEGVVDLVLGGARSGSAPRAQTNVALS